MWGSKMKKKVLVIHSGDFGIIQWKLKNLFKRDGFFVEKHKSNAFELSEITYYFFDVSYRNFHTFVRKHPEMDLIFIDKTLETSFVQQHRAKISSMVRQNSNKLRVVPPSFDPNLLFLEHPRYCEQTQVCYVLSEQDTEVQPITILPENFVSGQHFENADLAREEIIRRSYVRLEKWLHMAHAERKLIARMRRQKY